MNRLALAAALVVGLAAPAAWIASAPADAAAVQKKVIPRLTGSVTAANAKAFTKFVADHQDQVIGLQVRIDPSTDASFKSQGYLVSADSEPFSVFKRGGEGEGIEVVAPKAQAAWLHGAYVLDGFYVVKAGGMHQGILSYGLEKTDEGAIRANPAVAVKDVPVGR